MKIRACVIMGLLLAGAASAETVSVAVSKAELRSQPAVSGSKVVKSVVMNTPLSVQKTEGRYLQVKDPKGTLGWIHNTLVSDKPVAVVKSDKNQGISVVNDGVNVRKGPGKEHPVEFKAMRNETFQVLDQAENWLKISDQKGRSGWVWKTLTTAP